MCLSHSISYFDFSGDLMLKRSLKINSKTSLRIVKAELVDSKCNERRPKTPQSILAVHCLNTFLSFALSFFQQSHGKAKPKVKGSGIHQQHKIGKHPNQLNRRTTTSTSRASRKKFMKSNNKMLC